MRYVDELLVIYGKKSVSTRKFILSQVLDLAADPIDRDLVGLLWDEATSEPSRVANRARQVLGQYLPRFGELFAGPAEGLRQPPPTAEIEDRTGQARAYAGAGRVLADALNTTTRLLSTGSLRARTAASVALGLLWSPGIQKALLERISSGAPRFAFAHAVAEMGGDAVAKALTVWVERHYRAEPDAPAVLRAVPSPTTLACLKKLDGASDSHVRAGIALALATHDPPSCHALLERMVRRGEGWVTTYALNTIAGFGDPDYIPLLELALAGSDHEVVLGQVALAAGSIRAPASADLCRRLLANGSARVKALALEGLARQQIQADELALAARPFLTSEYPRLRAQATLLVARLEADAAEKAFAELLTGTDDLARIEAAWVLGFLRSRMGARLLGRMVAEDPSARVRREAIRSLGRFRLEMVLPVVLPLLESTDPTIVVPLCRVLPAISGASSALQAVDRLVGSRGAAAAPELVRCLALLASAARVPALPDPLLAALASQAPAVREAAADGLLALPALVDPAALEPLLSDPEPRVRAAAAVTMFFAGRDEAIGVLAKMLESDTDEVVWPGLLALCRIGTVLPLALGDRRFARFVEWLDRPAPGYSSGDASALFIPSPGRAAPSVASVRKTSLAEAFNAAFGQVPQAFDNECSGSLVDRYRPPIAVPVPAERPAVPDVRPAPVAVAPAPQAQPVAPAPPVQPVEARPRPAPAERTPTPGADPGRRPAPASPRPRGWIVTSALFLVAALATGVFIHFGVVPWIQTPQSPPPRPADPTLLRIWSLEGPASVSSGQADLGLALRPGDDLRTADGGRAILKDKAGNNVEMGSASRIAFEDTDPRTARGTSCRYAITGLSGQVRLDFRVEESVTIRDRRGTWILSRGVVRLEAASAELVVEEGTLVLREAGKAVHTVVAGGRTRFESTGP